MPAPITWTPEKKQDAIADILEHVSSGKSLRSLIDNSSRDVIPTFSTWSQWLSEDSELAKQYARAMEIRADILAEEIIEIADKQDKDVIEVDGIEYVQHNIVQRSRLQVDARKWAASKMNPKKYGDKIEVDSNNKHSFDTSNLSEEEKERLFEISLKLKGDGSK